MILLQLVSHNSALEHPNSTAGHRFGSYQQHSFFSAESPAEKHISSSSWFMFAEDVNHVPKIVRKKIQKERVENAMKNGAQRVAIDFTLSEDMNNKVL